MKTKIIFQISIIITMVFCTSVFAAKKQWSYDGWEQVYKIVADGKGGCAFARVETNDTSQVVWLDKKGDVIYQSNVIISNTPVTLMISFTSKHLLIHQMNNDIPYVTLVDKKGQATNIEKPDKGITTGYYAMYNPNELTDKKGFFAAETDLTTHRQRVIRYSYK